MLPQSNFRFWALPMSDSARVCREPPCHLYVGGGFHRLLGGRYSLASCRDSLRIRHLCFPPDRLRGSPPPLCVVPFPFPLVIPSSLWHCYFVLPRLAPAGTPGAITLFSEIVSVLLLLLLCLTVWLVRLFFLLLCVSLDTSCVAGAFIFAFPLFVMLLLLTDFDARTHTFV